MPSIPKGGRKTDFTTYSRVSFRRLSKLSQTLFYILKQTNTPVIFKKMYMKAKYLKFTLLETL